MSDEKFPLPGSSYKELSKIIAAYATVPGATAPGPVAQVAVVHDTVVSRNNKFLVAVGVIEGGQKKTCTTLGTKLGRAIQHDQEEAISEAWKTIVQQTDFLQKILSAVRIRKGMEESALASHIAFTAGSGKNAYARAGAGALIEILKLSRSIISDGSTLLAAAHVESMLQTDGKGNTDIVWTPIHTNKESGTSLLRADSSSRTGDLPSRNQAGDTSRGVRLNIELKIKCSVNELDGLGAKLRAICNDFETEEWPHLNVGVDTSDSKSAEKEIKESSAEDHEDETEL